ncbi:MULTISPECIES: ScbR family autoregulator-binding transcription factor [unclassified Streptomyces]|uniref:ScbR family autoregulator-binding transcription factor n=1 Tax=unclassified Streptomyces TaxID=2593676 RepID=UPI002740BF8A|nr:MULTISPECIES: ScbR family autoregulator-binding transcription factor [unclassified Streptomyces]
MRTRKAILEAAAEVFDERGFQAATIGEVLSRAGVTKGALYFHFPSKQALAQGVLDEQFRYGALTPRASKLQEVVDMGLGLAYRMRHDPMVRASARLSLEAQMVEVFGTGYTNAWVAVTEQVFREAAAQGELLPHVDPAESAWIFSAAWTGVQIYSQQLSGREDLEARISSLFAHLLPSIAVPAVLSRLQYGPERGFQVAEEGRRLAVAADEAEADAAEVAVAADVAGASA